MTDKNAKSGKTFEDAIQKLVTERPFSDMALEDALALFCDTLSRELGVSRVGVWELNEAQDELHLLILRDLAQDVTNRGEVLKSEDAQSYLDAIAGDYVLVIDDAMNDPRCHELAKAYLPDNNVASMLDCPIRTFGGLAGVVCIEQIGTLRQWTQEEVNFALAVTGLVSLTLEHDKRVNAEREVAETENRLKVYTELATDWYWQTDRDFVFKTVEGLPALDGQVPTDYVGRRLWDVPILSPLEGTWEDLKERIAQRKRIRDFVVCAANQEGLIFYAEISGIPKYDENGDYEGYWGVAKDISYRVRQSLAIAKMNDENQTLLRQLHLIFETCGIGAFWYDGAEEKMKFDQSFNKLYGVTETAALGPSNFAETKVHPEDRAGVKAFIMDAVRGKNTQGSHMFRAYRADGEIHHMRSFWKLENEDSGPVRDLIGLHMDITDVVSAREERAVALEHIAAIAENVPGVIWEVLWRKDRPSELLYISPKCVDFWGHGPEALMADPGLMTAGQDAEQVEEVRSVIQASVLSGKQHSHRGRIKKPGGADLWIDYRVQAVDQGNGTWRVLGIFLDVTTEVLAQQEAERQTELAFRTQKNESIGQLTGGVAHDFNNILAVIMGNLELLREDTRDGDRLELIDAGILASQRGAELTRSLLAFARKTRLAPEILDLNQVARQAQNWMRRALPDSIVVETSLLGGLWPARLDAALTESALLNLILNARDAMELRGKLTIETANVRIDQAYVDGRNEELEPGRYVMLAVSDTGSGMSADTMAQIFEPFFTTKPPGSGSGVGLSMVLGFVRQSGGTVQVYSEPGHGTTFKLYFPVVDNSTVAEPAAAPVPQDTAAAQGRILLVEDDPAVRNVILSMLKSGGYEVVTSNSGDAAFDLFQRDTRFDLVVTDIVMPGDLQGTHLAKALRETHPSLPFVFMSGYASEATVHGNGLKPDDIRLMKPVPKVDLMNAVSDLLGRERP